MKVAVFGLRRGGALAIAALFVLACGGDKAGTDGGATADGGPAADGGPRTDGGPRPDGGPATDGGGFDGGPAGTPENETVSTRTNDTLATAQTMAIGDTIDGTIGTAMGDDTDVDNYKFTAAAGDVLRVTLIARGNYQPLAVVRDQSGDYARIAIALEDASTATRQFYIPASGDYYFQILDLRNSGQTPQNVGGASFTYRLSVVRETVTPTTVTLPVTARAGTLSATDGVQIFSFTAALGNGLRAEVRAGRLSTPSDVDTILYLVDASGSTPAALAYNDDIDTEGGNYDSLVRAIATHAGTHQVVLDHYIVSLPDVGSPNRAFELDASTFDTTMEQEPNDDVTDANLMLTPVSGGAASTMTGSVYRTRSTGGGDGGTTTTLDRDLDFFRIDAAANTYYEIQVTKPSGSNSAFTPYVAFLDAEGNVTFANPNKPGNGSVRLEAFAFQAGPHYVAITDSRNTIAGAPVGGTDYTYQLSIGVIARTVTALGAAPVAAGAAGAISQGGKTVWYTFEVPAGGNTKLWWVDFDLSTNAGADGHSLNPFLLLYGTDGATALAGGNSIMLRDLNLPAGTYTLAMSDFDGAFSTTNHSFRPRIVSAGEFTPVTDDGTHTTRASALSISGDTTSVASTLTAGGQRWYALGSLTAGTGVTLVTGPAASGVDGGAAPVVDTKIQIVTSAGTDVAGGGNDDVGSDLFARVVGFKVPTTDTYFVRVDGGTSTAAGPYRLYIQKNVCPAGAASGVYVNEVLSNPGTSGADANGDGSTNGSDQFVELVNPTRTAADVSDFIVRDAAGARYRAACGTSIAAGQSLVVFGACASGTCAAGRAQANAAPATPQGGTPSDGLDLGTSDVVMLVSRTGAVVERIPVAAGTVGVSQARGAAGTCDVRPVPGSTPALQAHTACAGSAGNFSAGTRANGSAFAAPPALTNDVCGSATALTSGVDVLDQDTSGLTNNYDPIDAGNSVTCEAPLGVETYEGKDAAYSISIPAGKLLTVEVTPLGSWDPGVAIVTDCASAGATCRAVMDDAGNGGKETLTYRNPGSSALAVFIIVDAYAAAVQGEFTIRATISD
jgi:hypothetical protein